MHLFYKRLIEGKIQELDEQESRHAIRVLRLLKGDMVILVDGAGGWYEAVIEEAHPRRCILEVRSFTEDYRPLPYHLHIAISPTASMDRFEWFLEKATEIGISEITPLICRRTERKQVKSERLEKIIVSAMKQSLRAYKPLLSEPVHLSDFLKREVPGTRGIAHCHHTYRLALAELEHSGRYTLLIGPEGDFAAEEVSEAVSAGYQPFHMGESRLRTETAGIHLCSAIRIMESEVI
jgi:16S rRNA (uracil1498-N3)-methyltransferase